MGNCFSGPSRKEDESVNVELATYGRINFIPPFAEHTIRDKPVTRIHFVAHTVLRDGGNHWNIVLQTGSNESVCLNMVPGAWPGRHGYSGRLDISQHRYAVTPHHQFKLTKSVMRECTTVGHVVDAIKQADNHRYEFDKRGGGCTEWVRDQFRLFVALELISTGSEEQMELAICTAWERHVPTGLVPVARGTYLRDREASQSLTK